MNENLYDLIVIGGGSAGLGVGFRAAMRGLKVLLLEKHVLGGKASGASLRIMHGGFRYLQTLNIPRVMESARAQAELLETFPDLISPLRCVMPLTKFGFKSKYPVKAALTFYSLLSHAAGGRGHEGRIFSAQEVAEQIPILAGRAPAGALLWTDALLNDPDELSKVLSAAIVRRGGEVRERTGVTSVVRVPRGFQVLTESYSFIAKRVVNAAGAWIESVRPQGDVLPHYPHWCRAFNLIVSRALHPEYGIASQSSDGRLYFTVPRGHGGVIGTEYLPLNPLTVDHGVSEEEAITFLSRYNEACPGAQLTIRDVTGIEHGILPTTESDPYSLRGSTILNSINGYVEILTTKYTTFLAQADDVIRELKIV